MSSAMAVKKIFKAMLNTEPGVVSGFTGGMFRTYTPEVSFLKYFQDPLFNLYG